MSRGPQTFRQADVARAIKAARDAGEESFKVEINPDGRISVFVGKTEAPAPKSAVDKWLEDNGARQPQES